MPLPFPEVALEGLIGCYQWFFQHLLNILSFKAPCLETRGNKYAGGVKSMSPTPLTVDDLVANSLDAELLCCNKLLTGERPLVLWYHPQQPAAPKEGAS